MIYDKPREASFRGVFGKVSAPRPVTPRPVTPPRVPRPKQNKNAVAKAALFFAALYIGTALAFAMPLRPSYSETEKRELAKFPKFSTNALLNGSYFDGITSWFSDTFPMREQLTKMNTSLKKLSGFDSVAIHGDVEQGDEIPDAPYEETTAATTAPVTEPATEVQTTAPATTAPVTEPPQTTLPEKPDVNVQVLGAILIAGNSAYEYYNFSSDLAPQYISAVNNIRNAAPNCNTYTLLVPTSMDIDLNDAIRADINTSDQKKALDYFNSSFRGVTPVTGIYESLREHKADYQYFRTDHHWTALGAYRAYEQFAYAKGIQPVPLSQYETGKYDGFLGTFYASSEQSPALGNTPDTVITYKPFNNFDFTITDADGNTKEWNILTDVTDYAPSMKYLTFIGGDNPLSTVTNHDLTDNSACLVIKDSYGNALVPFLIPHYQRIYIVDPRHYNGTLSEFVSENNVDDIVFISNVSTTRNSIFIDAMTGFMQ